MEDLLGVGAVIGALLKHGERELSPEAAATDAAAKTTGLAAAGAGSVSGRELISAGFGGDVAVAVEPDACDFVPVLGGGAFTALAGKR